MKVSSDYAFFLSGALLAPSVYASTCQAPINHSGKPFSHVQPLNTTILTPYGSSPAVYPSRRSSLALNPVAPLLLQLFPR